MVRTVGTVRTVGLPSLSLHSLSYFPGQAGVRELEVPVREGEGEITSCSGSPTGLGYTTGCISASSVHRHQTRAPSRSPERVPEKEGQVITCIIGYGQVGAPIPSDKLQPPPSQQALYLACEPLGRTECHHLLSQVLKAGCRWGGTHREMPRAVGSG